MARELPQTSGSKALCLKAFRILPSSLYSMDSDQDENENDEKWIGDEYTKGETLVLAIIHAHPNTFPHLAQMNELSPPHAVRSLGDYREAFHAVRKNPTTPYLLKRWDISMAEILETWIGENSETVETNARKQILVHWQTISPNSDSEVCEFSRRRDPHTKTSIRRKIPVHRSRKKT